jgi:hypothetical protein
MAADSRSEPRQKTAQPRAWFNGAHLGDAYPCDAAGGWPEFEITLSFYVASDDPAVIESERQRMFERVPDLVLDDEEGDNA